MRYRTPAVAVACLFSIVAATAAPEGPPRKLTPAELFPDAAFDRAVPTQQQVTGVEHGARPLRPEEALRYLEALAEVSDRIKIIPYAKSHEGRPLVIAAIGDGAAPFAASRTSF